MGSYICPEQNLIPSLIENFFYYLNQIPNPIIRGIYAHHELVRILPFIDGNGRVARMAKNWILLFNLYPPIFVNSIEAKELYIASLNKSFKSLQTGNNGLNEHTENFFD